MKRLQRAIIVLLGPPGVGKGTQAALLASRFGLPHVATGDLFREALGQNTPLGLLAKSYMEKGQLVPDDVTIQMVSERLSRPDCARGAILDGFPSTVEQAEALDRMLAQSGDSVLLVLYLSAGEEVLLARLASRWTCRQCGAVYNSQTRPPKVPGVCDVCGGELFQRPDDTPETQRRRIQVYLEQTAPLVQFYRARGLLHEVSGEAPLEVVQEQLATAIEDALARRA